MAVVTLPMAATTTPDDWAVLAGTDKVSAVAAPDDGGTTAIRSPASANTEQWYTVSPAFASGSTITEIAVRTRAARNASDANFVSGYTFTPQGGGTQSGTSGTFTAVGAYADYTYTHSGLSVLWGSDFKVWVKNTTTNRVIVTTLEVTITYTPAVGVTKQAMYYARMRG